ncbi:MAG: hypothetical protein J6I68_14745 [Butyrivibrio sp.]|uniref:hypothetical protein n=1 Tax=Butyrivibrio sp. TaxID=28121 RepID=UPI001B6AF861|nr:hypothetical protein [Butyrivibrio sp.]MBP3784501.1 hypothetical protein [Butyrivibrio sp.]
MNTIMIAPAKVEPASKGSLAAFAEGKNKKGEFVRLRIQEYCEGAKPIYRLIIAEGKLASEIKENVKINDYLMITGEEHGYTNKAGHDEIFIKMTSFQVMKKPEKKEASTTTALPEGAVMDSITL